MPLLPAEEAPPTWSAHLQMIARTLAGEVSHMAEIQRTFQGDDIASDTAKTQLSEADVYHIIDALHTSFLDFHGEDHPMLEVLETFMDRVSSQFDIALT